MQTAIYPGSFDPITYGHLDVIERASRLCERIIIAVAFNEKKQCLFSPEERVELIQNATRGIPNVTLVTSFDGLLVQFARSHGATAIIRGLRAISDFEIEFQMALMNRKLDPDIETLFLMPKEEYTYLSSRIIKEISRLHGSISDFVPEGSAR
ncbi:MAG: pantetheine-phosphate adenylyltransferase, partial [Verrucomicrobiales bacterium]